jgi:hypothetical protein
MMTIREAQLTGLGFFERPGCRSGALFWLDVTRIVEADLTEGCRRLPESRQR